MKSLILLALVTLSFALPNVLTSNSCAMMGMDLIKPDLKEKMTLLKANPTNIMALKDMFVLTEKVRKISETCGISKETISKLGDIVEHDGVALLLESNCAKDLGILLLLADTIVEDPTDWQNDAVVSIFLGVLGYQGYKDCAQFYNYVI